MVAAAAIGRVHNALDSFQESREGARRFHRRDIGDVDVNHCFADFLARVRMDDRRGIEKAYWSKVTKGAMNEASGTAGGYTVPPDLSVGLMRDISTGSLWRRFGALTIPMKTQTTVVPMPDVSTVQAVGTAPYFGGFLMQWQVEASKASGENFSQTAPGFRNVELNAWLLGGYVYASNPFLQDAVGVEEWLTNLFANGAAWYQDLAFFQGTGTGQPQGVTNSAGAVSASRAGSNAIAVADAQGMIDNLLPSAFESGAVWFCHPTALPQITNFTGWFPNGPLVLYGLPLVPTGKCAKLGGTGDLILAAPSLYVIGDRMQYEVALATEEPGSYYNNQSAFRITSRVDGQPAVAAPITLSNGSSTVSPFVVLHS
jgi:HK97 family phage major capsid protein